VKIVEVGAGAMGGIVGELLAKPGKTVTLNLQNGWGNGPRIGSIVGERTLAAWSLLSQRKGRMPISHFL
jgi:hypothetical protein